MIFSYYFANAFYSKSMFVFIGFCGVQYTALLIKRIFPTGINNSYHNKWCFFTSVSTNLYKRIRNMFGGFYGIVQQVTKKGSNICISNKVNNSTSDICMERDMLIKAV